MIKQVSRLGCLLVLLTLVAACQRVPQERWYSPPKPPTAIKPPFPANATAELKEAVEGATEQTKVTTGYDPSYVKIDYPGGDVPSETGVCSDVIVRAFRKAGIDLQKEVHEE
ncbi:MAG TPA: DUF1287 domain-containing protein [Pyrinomonadaceae bacterium]|nr:DUF1287 domain-containing protein [Pyrinomonadaceae bacterium]